MAATDPLLTMPVILAAVLLLMLFARLPPMVLPEMVTAEGVLVI